MAVLGHHVVRSDGKSDGSHGRLGRKRALLEREANDEQGE
jgi:O6-methylguanine-DNA--protein-cysteine methyltransferase